MPKKIKSDSRYRRMTLLEIEGMENLLDSNSMAIKGIDLKKRPAGDEFVCRLLRAAAKCDHIKFLRFQDAEIEDDGICRIGKSLRDGLGRTVTSINISGNDLTPEACRMLSAGLSSCIRLRDFNFGRCKANDSCAVALSAGLSKVPLMMFYANENCIGPQGFAALCQSLGRTRSLSALYINHNPIGAHGVAGLSALLSSDTHLQLLDLSSCGLGIEGGRALGYMLMHAKNHVGALHLGHNDLSNLGSAEIVRGSIWSDGLHALDLRSNGITEAGAPFIAQAIHNMQNLRTVILSGNCIGDQGIAMIIKTASTLGSLKTLELTACFAGEESIAAMDRCLDADEFPSLRVLRISTNISDSSPHMISFRHHLASRQDLRASIHQQTDFGTAIDGKFAENSSSFQFLASQQCVAPLPPTDLFSAEFSTGQAAVHYTSPKVAGTYQGSYLRPTAQSQADFAVAAAGNGVHHDNLPNSNFHTLYVDKCDQGTGAQLLRPQGFVAHLPSRDVSSDCSKEWPATYRGSSTITHQTPVHSQTFHMAGDLATKQLAIETSANSAPEHEPRSVQPCVFERPPLEASGVHVFPHRVVATSPSNAASSTMISSVGKGEEQAPGAFSRYSHLNMRGAQVPQSGHSSIMNSTVQDSNFGLVPLPSTLTHGESHQLPSGPQMHQSSQNFTTHSQQFPPRLQYETSTVAGETSGNATVGAFEIGNNGVKLDHLNYWNSPRNSGQSFSFDATNLFSPNNHQARIAKPTEACLFSKASQEPQGVLHGSLLDLQEGAYGSRQDVDHGADSQQQLRPVTSPNQFQHRLKPPVPQQNSAPLTSAPVTGHKLYLRPEELPDNSSAAHNLPSPTIRTVPHTFAKDPNIGAKYHDEFGIS